MQPPRHALLRKTTAEMVGTFALVFAGCGASVVDANSGSLGHVGVSAVFGLVIAVMIFATGHVSGAHFNPAVTLAFAGSGRFPWRQVPAYITGQVFAALAGAIAVAGLIGTEAHVGATIPTVHLAQAFGLEVVMSFFLMFVITAVASDLRASGHLAALAIGGTVALCALMGGPLTGASMNPARTLGPALVSGQTGSVAIYLVAPVIGAALGAWCYGFVASLEGSVHAKDHS
ncbi:MAG: aquaporin [Proteobacteria bacterium]|nr:aquaporin [Pseudomonadota bacterium]